jgi:RNA polymerase sigma factor (sigma-70 family)
VTLRSAPGKSDADLVREALLGARDPLAELVTRHWDTAVFLCARILGSPDLARDAAQEAAVAAMTDLGRLRSPDRFGAWFCGIALNVARRWLRHLRTEIPGAQEDLASAGPGPAEAAEAAEIATLVRAAGSQLTEVRLTRLTDSVFYAAVIVAGPDGPREVDARPSDAVNLALEAGAPIRADSKLFGDDPASSLTDKLQSVPIATAQIAAEAQQSMQELLGELGHSAD